jgi:nicotinate dehydrogenase subunit B
MSAPDFSAPQLGEGPDLLVIGAAIREGDFASVAVGHPDVAARTMPPDGLDLWLAIVRDGTVMLYAGKMELGSGGRTIFTQFVAEHFMEELTSAAGIDSLDFRLTDSPDARDLELLTTAVRLIACQPKKAPKTRAKTSSLTGCGIAMSHYGAHDARAALMIDVEIEPITGKVTLTRACIAFDCSWVRNVKDLADQVERALVRGFSRPPHQQAPLDRKNVTRLSWNDARMLTFAELPLVQLHLISRPDRPWGSLVGAGTVATAAALANAVLDASGKHSGQVVLDPDSVKAII